MGSRSLGDLIDGALAGDQGSWNCLVERYTPLIWAIARGHRLASADCEDVCQATWMRVFQYLGQLRDPERLAQWVSVTARRESLKHLKKSGRDVPVSDSYVFDRSDPSENIPEERALAAARDEEVLRAFSALSFKSQALLGLLVTDPPMSYDEISETLGMPRGSIGPTRARSLAQLKRILSEQQEATTATIALAEVVNRTAVRTHVVARKV